MIEKILLGYEYIFVFIIEFLSDKSVVFIIPLSILLVFLYTKIKDEIQINILKEIYKIKNEKTSIFAILKNNLTKSARINNIINFIAKKISVFNDYSLEKNKNISLFIIMFIFILFAVTTAIVLPENTTLWYITFFYMFIAIATISIIIFFSISITRMRVLRELPITFKLLNSRFISKSKMLDAIEACKSDFPKPIQRDMKKIHSVLNKNDQKEIEETFSSIEELYNDEYMTVLLLLIKQAHFKGNAKQVEEQFEEVTEDILNEIENQRDLQAISRMYMIVSIITIPIMFKIIEIFSIKGVGQAAIDFYGNNPIALGIKIITALLMLIYTGYLLYLEKSV